MNSRLALWNKVNNYFREGVIIPIRGDYIVCKEKFVFEADLIGSLILVHVGPTKFGVKEMPAIEPGGVSELLGVYKPREIALLECAYEGQIFDWSRAYLSRGDILALSEWFVSNSAPPIEAVRNRFRFFLTNLIASEGDINLKGFLLGNS